MRTAYKSTLCKSITRWRIRCAHYYVLPVYTYRSDARRSHYVRADGWTSALEGKTIAIGDRRRLVGWHHVHDHAYHPASVPTHITRDMRAHAMRDAIVPEPRPTIVFAYVLCILNRRTARVYYIMLHVIECTISYRTQSFKDHNYIVRFPYGHSGA